MENEPQPVRLTVKRLRLEKYEGEIEPGKKPFEVIEIEYDDEGMTPTSRAGQTWQLTAQITVNNP